MPAGIGAAGFAIGAPVGTPLGTPAGIPAGTPAGTLAGRPAGTGAGAGASGIAAEASGADASCLPSSPLVLVKPRRALRSLMSLIPGFLPEDAKVPSYPNCRFGNSCLRCQSPETTSLAHLNRRLDRAKTTRCKFLASSNQGYPVAPHPSPFASEAWPASCTETPGSPASASEFSNQASSSRIAQRCDLYAFYRKFCRPSSVNFEGM